MVNKKIFIGFNLMDEEVIRIISQVIKLKLDQLVTHRRCENLENEVIHTLKIAGVLCTQRSFADLIKQCKKVVPPYFDFEAANVLLKDVKTGMLFTMNEVYVNKENEHYKETEGDDEEGTDEEDSDNRNYLSDDNDPK